MAPTKDPECHFAAAAVAAIFNFPLWRASAIAQSGFKVPGKTALERYYRAALQPPYRGTIATVGGMTWARATIFYGSEYGNLLFIIICSILSLFSFLFLFFLRKEFYEKTWFWWSILFSFTSFTC